MSRDLYAELHYAIQHDDTTLAEHLIREEGADPTERGGEGHPAALTFALRDPIDINTVICLIQNFLA